MRYAGQKMCAIISLVILSMLSGCVTGSHAGSFCGIYQPVYTSTFDTEETRKQVDENNAVWEKECK